MALPSARSSASSDSMNPTMSRSPRRQTNLPGRGPWLYAPAVLDREGPLRRIVGWPDDRETADFDGTKYRERLPQIEQIPEVGALAQGAEKVIDPRPGVTVLTMSAYKSAQDGAVDTLAKTGIHTVVVDFGDNLLQTTASSVQILGLIMGRPARRSSGH